MTRPVLVTGLGGIALLELLHVSFSYPRGENILNDVSLTVKQGEFIAIAGRNGSGKTTLTRLVMSLLKPTDGEIFFEGKSTQKLCTFDMAHYIGYVFQNPDRQIFRDTVYSEVSYGPEQLGFAPEKITEVVEQALLLTGLSDIKQAYPRILSKSQKQRVAIASALALQPKIIILDEPTSGQDVWQKEKLMYLLQTLNAKGVTVIMVTHDMNLLLDYIPRTIVISSGKKVFDGSTGELFKNSIQLKEWGLQEPSLISICREFGIGSASSLQELYNKLLMTVGEKNV